MSALLCRYLDNQFATSVQFPIFYFRYAIPLCYYPVQLCCYAVQLFRRCLHAVQSRAVPAGLANTEEQKANFKMAAGLLFLTFFAFHGTSGNQTENNVNIFVIVKFFYWTFLLP